MCGFVKGQPAVKLHRDPPPLPVASMENSRKAVSESLGVLCRLRQRSGEVDVLAALELTVNAWKPHDIGLPSIAHWLPRAHVVAVALKDSGKLTFGRSAFCLARLARDYQLLSDSYSRLNILKSLKRVWVKRLLILLILLRAGSQLFSLLAARRSVLRLYGCISSQRGC